MGEQKARPVIALKCPQEVPDAQSLCLEMTQALQAASSNGAVVRRLQDGEVFAPRAGDLEVALHLEAVRDDHLAGHLEWRSAETMTAQKGPSVALDVMDSGLSGARYGQFVRGLMKATPQLLTP